MITGENMAMKDIKKVNDYNIARTKSSCLINSKLSTRTLLTACPNIVIITQRTMVTTVKSLCKLTTKTQVNQIKRNMACRTMNQRDKQPVDSQANKNNPFYGTKAHFECHRTICDTDPSCINKICPNICGNPIDRKSVGHATSGQSLPTETDRITIVVSTTDLSGKAKPKGQRMVLYKKPHRTKPTAEHKQGTAKLKQEPLMEQLINDHENKDS